MSIYSNEQAESAFIAHLILKPEYQEIYREKIEVDYFTTEENKKFAQIITESETIVDSIVLTSQGLTRDWIVGCVANSSLGTVETSLVAIIEAYTKRQALEMSKSVIDYQLTDEGSKYFDYIQDLLDQNNEKIKQTKSYLSSSNAIVEWIKSKNEEQDSTPPYFFGVEGLDRYELRNGHLCSVVARTKAGKTALLLQTAVDAAKKGLPVLLITLEINENEALDKIIANIANLNPTVTSRYGQKDFVVTETGTQKINKALQELSEMKLYIIHASSMSCGDIRRHVAQFKRENSNGLVLIDQLQFLTGNGKNKIEQYDYILQKLKKIAMDYKIKMILAHQMNREIEKRGGEFPNTSDIKDSGRVEEISDLIILFARKDQNKNESPRNFTVVSRHQAGGFFVAGWNNKLARFNYSNEI